MLQPQAACEGGAEGGGNPSVRCGGQLPLHSSHRLSSSSCAGVAVGLIFSKRVHRTLFSQTLDLQPLCGLRKGTEGGGTPQSAAAASSLTCFSRKRPAKGEPKEGTTPQSAAAASSPYTSSHRNSFSSYSGVAHGLFYEKAILWPFRKNAHASAASGLRRGAKEGTTPQSAAADSSPYTGEPKEGEPLSPLRRTAPLTFFAPK